MKNRIVLLISALLATNVHAVLPEPDFILLGTVTGTPPWQMSGDAAGLTLELRLEGAAEPLVDAVIAPDGTYALRVPIDSVDPQQPGTSRAGDELDLFLDGVLLDDPSSPASLLLPLTGERGTFLEFDIDLDSLIAGPNFTVASASTVEDVFRGVVNVVITLANRDGDQPEEINWVSVEGTATAAAGDQCDAGADFIPTAGVAQFPAGTDTFAVPVTLCNDTLPENEESFVIRIGNPSSDITLSRSEATVTIVDDDGVPTLFVNDVSVREPETGTTVATFRVTLNAAQSTPVRFDFATEDLDAQAGLDYNATSGRRGILPGETTLDIDVEILADRIPDDGEMFLLRLSNANGAEIGDDEGIGTIADFESDGTLLVDSGAGQTTLNGPVDLAVHPAGTWLFVANELGETISRFDIDPDTSALTNELRWGEGQLPGARLGGLSGIEISPDGRWLLATAPSDNAINLLRIDGEGSLVPGSLALQSAFDKDAVPFAGLSGVTHATFSDDGLHIYAIGAADSLTVLSLDGADGQLLMTELEANGLDDAFDTGGEVKDLVGPADIIASSDGRSVYVAAAGGDAVLHFSREADAASTFSGRLSFRASYAQAQLGQAGLDGVNRLALSGDGRHLYAVSAATGELNVFGIGVNGQLTFIEATDTAEPGSLAGASSLALSRDESVLLATSSTPGSLHIFARLDSGEAGPRQVLLANRDAVIGLAGATALAPSPVDPAKVFAAAYIDNRVSLFALSISSIIFSSSFEGD